MTVLPVSDPDRGSVGVSGGLVRRGIIRSFDYRNVAEPTWSRSGAVRAASWHP